ncbi:MAG: hypothetical protein ABEL76_14085 [Bradymonadaceae bacterium]
MDWNPDADWWNILATLAGVVVLFSFYAGLTMVAPPFGGWAVYVSGAGLAVFSGGAVEEASPVFGWGTAVFGACLLATPFVFGFLSQSAAAAAVALPGLIGLAAGGMTARGK